MEEILMEKGQFITTLQKTVMQIDIPTLVRQIIEEQRYRTKIVEVRCAQREIILNLIVYVIYRERSAQEGRGEEEMALLQYEIKRWFAILPGRKSNEGQINNSSRNFLNQILFLAQIIHKIIQNHRLAPSNQINAQTIFITIVYLSTDKLVSPYCFAVLHRRLQKPQLPHFNPKRKPEENNLRHSSSSKCISAAYFKQEMRNILNPSRQKKGQREVKKVQSVYILYNNYKRKENNEHYLLFKHLKENPEPIETLKYKTTKSFSEQNINRKSEHSSLGKNSHTKWSKCELVKTQYVPFCASEAKSNQVCQKTATNYLNYRISKQKLTIDTEKPRVLLKI